MTSAKDEHSTLVLAGFPRALVLSHPVADNIGESLRDLEDGDEDALTILRHILHTVQGIQRTVTTIQHTVTTIERRQIAMAQVTQQELDAIGAAIQTQDSSLAAAIQAIDDQVKALMAQQPTLDLTSIQSAVDALTGLVAQAGPVPPPTPPPAPGA